MKLFFKLPVSINDVKYTWYINGDEVTQNVECNHEEADTRMVLDAALLSEDLEVVTAGTDVLIFTVKQKWVFRYDDEKCADIETILLYLGK